MRLRRFPMWVVILAGYLAFDRTFAYVGVPPLYIGEAYLSFKVLQNSRNWVSRFVSDTFRFRLLPLAIALHMSWGIIEVARSWFMGRSIIESMRTAAFNYYPLYLLIGIALGWGVTMQSFVRLMKIVIVVCALRTLLEFVYPGLGVAVNITVTPIIIIAMWNRLSDWKWRVPCLIITIFPIFFHGTHGRGSVLGLLAGIIATLLSNPARLLRWGMASLGAVIVLFFVGPLIPGPSGGAPPLDPVVQVARIIASDHPNTAIRIIKWRVHGKVTGAYLDELDNLIGARGTASWRQVIWKNAMRSLNTPTKLAMGQGEATSLAGMTPDGQDIHTPHNITIYCIYYTGWVGMFIFFLLIFAIWNTGMHLGFAEMRALYSAVFWSTLLVAITGNCLETPFGAIPLYLLLGVIVGIDRRMVAIVKQARRMAANPEPLNEDAPPAMARAFVTAGSR
jgi:hypothetical protein